MKIYKNKKFHNSSTRQTQEMKLTPHLISTAPSYLNPLKDRVLILRGLKALVIENFGVTLDSYETIDLTDNNIELLGNFPNLNRLKTLLISQNNIEEIEVGLFHNVPNLTNLQLSSNNLSNLSNVCDSLKNFKRLTSLVLKDNPVTTETDYRLYVIWLLPSLKILDFEKIKDKERELARALFESSSLNATKDKTTTQVDNDSNQDKKLKKIINKLSDEERKVLELKLVNATNLDEIEMIENALKNGIV